MCTHLELLGFLKLLLFHILGKFKVIHQYGAQLIFLRLEIQ